MLPDALIGRIERLERQNQTMKIALASGLAVVGLLAVLQFRSVVYDDVRARQFTLLDNKDNVRGILGVAGSTAVFRLGKTLNEIQVNIEAQTAQTSLTLRPSGAREPLVDLFVDPSRSFVVAGEFQETAKAEPKKETTSP